MTTAQGHTSLRSLINAQVATAKRISPSDAEIAGLFEAQLQHLRDRVRRIERAIAANHARLKSEKDPRWRDWWLLNARYDYNLETIAQVEQAGHVRVCPGVCPDGGTGVEREREFWDALSLRGHLTGEGPLAWYRTCEACNLSGAIAQSALQLERRWKEDNP